MKYKKYSYILVLILMLVVGMNGVHAKPVLNKSQDKTCYYMSDDGKFKTRITVYWDLKWFFPANLTSSAIERGANDTYTDVTIDKVGDSFLNNSEHIHNWLASDITNVHVQHIRDRSVTFSFKYQRAQDANKGGEPTCPRYVVFEDSTKNYRTWVTDDLQVAQKAKTNINAYGDIGYYGTLTTADEYWKDEIALGIIEIDDGEVTCADYETIFGDPDDDGETNDPDGDGQSSIRYLIKTVLQYVRIIVPILVIVLGILDFAKAVMAGKEDNMRKARSDFIKRVLMGVAVFFVPLLVDVIMDLADIVWNGSYPNCGL